MNQKLIIGFLIGAAVVGFLLDARQKRMQSRTANPDVRVVIPQVDEAAITEIVG